MQRMGDLILSYPLLLWLARRYPGHPLYVAAEENFYKPLMKLSPAATYFPWSGAGVLRGQRYELVINLSIRDRAARLAHELEADRVIGPVLAPDGSRFVHGDWQLYRTSLVGNNLYNRFHWADLNALDVVPHADMAATRFQPPRTMPADNAKVGVFVGASEEAKRPDAAFQADLLRELLNRGLRPVLFGGPAEKELGADIERRAGVPVLNLCGKLGLEEFGAVGQTLSLFITPDTGPMHLAAWTGLKCLNLSMGHVNPWETGPYPEGHYVLRSDLECARGCWHCSRSKLHCHEAFEPRRIAALAARLVAGAASAKLAGLRLPGLDLFVTGRRDGLYHLERVARTDPDEERLLARFWQAFFGSRFGLWGEDRPARAWADAARHAPQAADILLAHLPEMGRQFSHGLKTGSLRDGAFWSGSPTVIRPLTGFAQMALENGDHSRASWVRAMADLEALIACCR
ncbi:glycosyltransferase family 9 protein [Pseudodesulfovibrio cashew]|uniref:Glycosyltransferase family 9 protein n=2 Tax=Pseudodesulfovibrio cashew TaxID=2678688 RepID=A0A6I6JP02_9BACT|nr:glycosyltransferase family 9 protein [Pseudodesulfovibrio cashew]